MAIARSLRVLLAIALLAAWTNALVHPIEHVDEAGAFVHLADGHGDGERDGNAADPLCDAIAAVAACVQGGSTAVFSSFSNDAAPESGNAGSVAAMPLLAYRSQAPPQVS